VVVLAVVVANTAAVVEADNKAVVVGVVPLAAGNTVAAVADCTRVIAD